MHNDEFNGLKIVNGYKFRTNGILRNSLNKYNRAIKINSMSSQYTSKLINELKQQTQDIKAADLLYLISHLIAKKDYPLEYIQKFIGNNYSHQSINWKSMDQMTILNLYHDSIDYIEKHRKQWKAEDQKQEQLWSEYMQEKKRISKILKEKSFTKEELIDSYLQQIRRNKTILAKASPQKQPQKQFKQTTTTLDKYKYEQNIELLQKRIQIMRDSTKFDQEHDDKGIFPKNNSHLTSQQTSLNKIVEQLQFKKNYFEDLQKNFQLEEAFQKKKKLLAKTKSLNKKIKQLFLHYSSQNYDPTLSFQKNQVKLVHIDLRLFLKYFKELKEAHSGQYFINDQKNDKQLKTNNLTVVFKKYSQNSRQINFIQFLQINYDLFFHKQNAFEHLTQTQILGEIKQKIQIQPHESLDLFESELSKFQQIKDVFYNEKVHKIINITQKYHEIESEYENIQRKPHNKTTDGPLPDSKIRQKKFGKFIDKTIEDYETTKNKIHDTFLRRHRKQTIQNFEYRLNAHQKNSIEIIVSKNTNKNSTSSQINEKNVFKRRSQDEPKQINYRNITDLDINFHQKNIFSQIIKEVDEQNDEDQHLYKFKHQRSQSSADLLLTNDRINKGNAKIGESALSKRRSSTCSLKSVFTLPKITRLSEEKIENQSITKTLSYLYNKLGKQEEPRIKKILQIDNSESLKAHKIQNQYLKEYFSQQTSLQSSKLKEKQQKSKLRKEQLLRPNCNKFRQENYSKFMKFS